MQNLDMVPIEIFDYAVKQLYTPDKSLEENLYKLWTTFTSIEATRILFKKEDKKEAGVFFFDRLTEETLKKLADTSRFASLCDLHFELKNLF